MFAEKSKEGDEIKDDLELSSDSEEENDNEANHKKVCSKF